MKKTVVIGASPNPQRYAHTATEMLMDNDFEVVPVGLRNGKIRNLDILTGQPDIDDVHTVTLYVGPKNQMHWKDYIFSLNPERIIFNPGTEGSTFEKEAQERGIEVLRACTLVMISIGNY